MSPFNLRAKSTAALTGLACVWCLLLHPVSSLELKVKRMFPSIDESEPPPDDAKYRGITGFTPTYAAKAEADWLNTINSASARGGSSASAAAPAADAGDNDDEKTRSSIYHHPMRPQYSPVRIGPDGKPVRSIYNMHNDRFEDYMDDSWAPMADVLVGGNLELGGMGVSPWLAMPAAAIVLHLFLRLFLGGRVLAILYCMVFALYFGAIDANGYDALPGTGYVNELRMQFRRRFGNRWERRSAHPLMMVWAALVLPQITLRMFFSWGGVVLVDAFLAALYATYVIVFVNAASVRHWVDLSNEPPANRPMLRKLYLARNLALNARQMMKYQG